MSVGNESSVMKVENEASKMADDKEAGKIECPDLSTVYL